MEKKGGLTKGGRVNWKSIAFGRLRSEGRESMMLQKPPKVLRRRKGIGVSGLRLLRRKNSCSAPIWTRAIRALEAQEGGANGSVGAELRERWKGWKSCTDGVFLVVIGRREGSPRGAAGKGVRLQGSVQQFQLRGRAGESLEDRLYDPWRGNHVK